MSIPYPQITEFEGPLNRDTKITADFAYLDHNAPWISVLNYSPKGGGADDTIPFKNAFLDSIAANTFCFVPEGSYKINVSLTSAQASQLRLFGAKQGFAGGVFLGPYDTTKYTLSLGDTSANLNDITLENLFFHGGGTGQYGLKLVNPYHAALTNVTSRGCTKINYLLTGEVGASYIDHIHCFVANPNVSGSKGFVVNANGGYVTAVQWIGGSIQGASNNAGDYAIELDNGASGVQIRFIGAYHQFWPTAGLHIKNTGITVDHDLTTYDKNGSSSGDLVTFDSNVMISDYMQGIFTLNGSFGMPAGSASLPGGGGLMRNAQVLTNPQIQSAIYFLDQLLTNNQQFDQTNISRFNINRSSSNMSVESSGAVQLNGQTGGASSSPAAQLVGHGNVGVCVDGNGHVGFFGNTCAAQQAITGALSTVTDAAAKAVLTSIISALAAYNQVTNSTT